MDTGTKTRLMKVAERPRSRLEPVSRVFGLDRGTPIDRHYIERFLDRCSGDIHGHVLEVGDSTYTRRFGGPKVTRLDVLHAVDGNGKATIIGDLASGKGIPQDAFDCIILTQVLHCIFDVRGALRHARAALRPDGVLLATLPGISQISRYDMDRWGDFWRFTTRSARRLATEVFAGEAVDVRAHGNVLVAKGFLDGMAVEEFRREELEADDPDYELLITLRACRSAEST